MNNVQTYSAFDSMRFTGLAKDENGFGGGGQNKLGGIVLRTLELGLDPFSVEGMRTAGFTAFQALLEADPVFRAMAPFPTNPDPTIEMDTALVRVGMDRLQFVADLLSEGLVYPLSDPLSVPFLGWNLRGRAATPRRVMNPASRGETSVAPMTTDRLPIYLTMADNQFNIRDLRNSRRIGIPLDTAGIEDDIRAVNEAIEDAAVNGATTLDGQALQVGGYDAPGLINAPNANTKSLSLADWVTTPNGTNIMLAITQMLGQLAADHYHGPYNLYVPTAVGIGWSVDFKANGNDSVMSRLQQITAIKKIVPLDSLPATKVALIQMTNSVVDIIDGQRPTVIPFTSLDGFTLYNVILAAMIPRFRSDSDGNSGIVIGTLS